MSLSTGRWTWPDVPPLWLPRARKSEWGPKAWNWLHLLAINYPPRPTLADARLAARHVWRFVAGLPCAECRLHAVWHLRRRPPALAGTEALQAWVWAFHNAVNVRLGKRPLLFEEYLEIYSDELCWAAWSTGCQLAGQRG